MPFAPLTPEEQKKYPEPCRSPQHNPPSHMVFYKTMKWVCPSCGHVTIVSPNRVYMMQKPEVTTWKQHSLSHGSHFDYRGAEARNRNRFYMLTNTEP